MKTALLWHSYRYMPYEKRLAVLEAERLSATTPVAIAEGVMVEAKMPQDIARRFTYFSEVVSDDGRRVVPDQAAFEASVPKSPAKAASRIGQAKDGPNTRQATRYSAHGIHEYRGKFNPQVVRATTNVLGLKPGSLLLDPFCGSGTVLLESAHLGFDALGFDLHPLAVMISCAKVAAYHAQRSAIRRAAKAVLTDLAGVEGLSDRQMKAWLDRQTPLPTANSLPNSEYLREWFPELVLRQLAFAMESIRRRVPKALQGLFLVVLSDVVRDVSWQEPADLRIRRRAEPSDNYPALELFADGLQRKSAVICASPPPARDDSRQIAMMTDSRQAEEAASALRASFGTRRIDAVISSPPYATALPYVDMHRLSLCLLGLIPDRQIRDAERSLIGNREITDRERRAIEERILANADSLPASCYKFCLQLLKSSQMPGNGFRRKNTPSLLYKYLTEMRATCHSLAGVMRKHAPLALVIGPNRCSLGGIDFDIDTPELLRAVAESAGFAMDECIELDAYQRYALHQQNSIRREVLLVMRKR